MSLMEKTQLRTEMLDGKIVSQSPRPSVNHNIVSGNLFRLFGNYLENNTCTVFNDGTDVFLTKKDRVVPDLMVICNPSIIKYDGIHGVPTLIIEVLSPSTAKKDKGYKMSLYAQSGVGEYWLVDPLNRTIEVYLLQETAYHLENVYVYYPEYEIDEMTDEERAELVAREFATHLFPNLKIPLEAVFKKTIGWKPL